MRPDERRAIPSARQNGAPVVHASGAETPARDGVCAALRFLASVFAREPDRALLALVRQRRAALAEALDGDPLEGLDLDRMDETIEDLAVEYCRLFIGPSGHLPPIESVVMEGQFQGKAAAEVEAFYRAHGLHPSDDVRRDGPDHLALEVDYLASLEERGLHDEAGCFARAHPLRWLPLLMAHIGRRSQRPFFRAWAAALHAVLTDLYAPASSDLRKA